MLIGTVARNAVARVAAVDYKRQVVSGATK